MRNQKIMLVADDMVINRIVLDGIFSNEYKIVTAEDGEKAIRYIRQHHKEITIVLLDIFMPVMDGYEVLKIMKEEKYIEDIPVIVISGVDTVENEIKALELGADDFVLKPFEAEVVKKRLENVLDSRKYKRHLEEEINRNKRRQSVETMDLEVIENSLEFQSILRYLNAIVIKINAKADSYEQIYTTYSDLKGLPQEGSVQEELFQYLQKNMSETYKEETMQWLNARLEKQNISCATMDIPIFNVVYSEYQWYQITAIQLEVRQTCDGIFLLIIKNRQNELEYMRNLIGQVDGNEESIKQYFYNNEEIRVKAQIDTLTGVNNELTSEGKIKEVIQMEHDAYHGIILLDIDNFKRFNENYGETAGDEVLCQIAGVLKKQSREGDVVGRMKADKFIVCLRNIPDRQLMENIGKRFMEAVKLIQMKLRLQEFITVSMGIAVYPNDGEKFEELLESANQALFVAKNFGKNQFRLYQECKEYLHLVKDTNNSNEEERR